MLLPPQDTNHATVNVYQWPEPPTIAQRVNLMMLGSMLHRKAFDELRTTRQLGSAPAARRARELNRQRVLVLARRTRGDRRLD